MPSEEEVPLEECPPPQTVMTILFETANLTAVATSCEFEGKTTTAYKAISHRVDK
jgi:hypothetical protein